MTTHDTRWQWSAVTFGTTIDGEDHPEEERVLIYPEGISSMQALLEDEVVAETYGDDAEQIAAMIVEQHNKTIDGNAP